MKTLVLCLALSPAILAQGETVTSMAFVTAGGGSSNSPGVVSYTSLPDLGGGEICSTSYGLAAGFLEANEPEIPSLPIVYDVSPGFGSNTGGTVLTVTGVNFDLNGSGASLTVAVGGYAASGVTLVSNTTLTCTTPVGAMGSATLCVTNSLGSALAPEAYVYTPAVTSTFASSPGATVTVTNYGTPGSSFVTFYVYDASAAFQPSVGFFSGGPGGATPALGFTQAAVYPAPDGVHVTTIPIPSDPGLGIGSLRVQTLMIESLTPLETALTNAAVTIIGP